MTESVSAALGDIAPLCPGCGADTLQVEWRLTAAPLGSYSLAGAQDKIAAREVPWLVCGHCGIAAQGTLDLEPEGEYEDDDLPPNDVAGPPQPPAA